MTKYFLVYLLLLKSLYAQELKVEAILLYADRNIIDYVDDEGGIINSFAIDSSAIYIGDANHSIFYFWNYKISYSHSNPKNIYGFDGSNAIKKDGDIIINSDIYVLNVKTGEKQAVLFGEEKGVDTDPSRTEFSVSDSVLYYFSSRDPFRRKLVSFSYDLKYEKKNPKQLNNYLSHVMNVHGQISDVFVRGNKLISIYRTFDQTTKKSCYPIVCWNIQSDSLVTTSYIQKDVVLPKICGIDSQDNIYVCSSLWDRGEYTLWVLSSQLKILQEVHLDSLINGMPFMENNKYYISKADFEPSIVGVVSDNKELYFMVKTLKGLYFLKYYPIVHNR